MAPVLHGRWQPWQPARRSNHEGPGLTSRLSLAERTERSCHGRPSRSGRRTDGPLLSREATSGPSVSRRGPRVSIPMSADAILTLCGLDPSASRRVTLHLPRGSAASRRSLSPLPAVGALFSMVASSAPEFPSRAAFSLAARRLVIVRAIVPACVQLDGALFIP
jgi:hypothetical protein